MIAKPSVPDPLSPDRGLLLCRFVSVGVDGLTLTSDARLDLASGAVFDIELVGVEGDLDGAEYECIELPILADHFIVLAPEEAEAAGIELPAGFEGEYVVETLPALRAALARHPELLEALSLEPCLSRSRLPVSRLFDRLCAPAILEQVASDLDPDGREEVLAILGLARHVMMTELARERRRVLEEASGDG